MRTTATTTSSRTRCCGSSSTRCGARRLSPELDRAVPRRVARRLRARQPNLRRRGRRRNWTTPGRDGLLPRLPPLSRAAHSCARRGPTRSSRTSCTSRGRSTGRCCRRAATRGARRPARERRRRLPHSSAGRATSCAAARISVGGTEATRVTHHPISIDVGRVRRAAGERRRACARRATLDASREADRPSRPHRPVEEHRARLPRVRAPARRASASGAGA